MNTPKYAALLAIMLCTALAACSSTGMNDSSGSSMSGSSSTGSDTSRSSSAGAMNTPSASTTMAPGGDMAAGPDAMMGWGVVQAIDPMPMAATGTDAGSAGTSTSGSSVTGTSAAGGASDSSYRVTLRMDDGSMKMVMQGSKPSFQVGDRVHMASGMLQKN